MNARSVRFVVSFLLFAVSFAGACLPPDDDATSSGGGGDAGSPCDGKGDCAACTQCAAQLACAKELATCQANSACIGLDECITICGNDLSCRQQCYAGNSGGVTAYEALASCYYCDACPKDCAGYRSC